MGDEVEVEEKDESSNHGDKEESIGSHMDTGWFSSPEKRSIPLCFMLVISCKKIMSEKL